MSKARRKLWWLLLLLILAVPAYYILVVHSPARGTPYALDLAAVRSLAGSMGGAKPQAIRFERIMSLQFAEAMIMAGDPWRASPMPVYAYQLVFPDRTVMIDAALPRQIAKPDFLVMDFDTDAYQRLLAALDQTSLIAVTHEHMDHIGGIAEHPRLGLLLPALRLTAEQLANPKGMAPARLPDQVMQGYTPLRYDRLHLLAPGVVLIKAPGHTPGSQMVYVQRADGREVLLLGDVSWRRRNIDQVRERPLFMTLIIGEDRNAVLGQFAALRELAAAEPGIALVPGHDGPAMEPLVADRTLEPGLLLR